MRRRTLLWRLRTLRRQVHPDPQEMAGALNAATMQLGISLSSPDLVLPILVRALGGSNVLIGTLPALRWSLVWLPQFLVSGWLQERRRRLPFYQVMELARMLSYAFLGILVVLLLPGRATLFLWIFFALFAASRVVAGAGSLALTDVFGRIVRHEGRVRFFAIRSFAGALGSLLAGGLVSLAFRAASGSTSTYGLLFGASALAFFGAVVAAQGLREPEAPASLHHVRLVEQCRRVPRLLRTPNFGRFLAVRVLVAMVHIADPFYIVYAVERLGAPPALTGLYMTGMTLASLTGTFVWPHLDTLWGRERTLRLTLLASTLGPLLALGLGGMATLLPSAKGVVPYLFALVFMTNGFGEFGRGISFSAYMLDVSPPEDRPTYLGFMNSVLGIAALAPMFGGWLVDHLGYGWLFCLALGLLGTGTLLSLRLGSVDAGVPEACPEEPQP